MFDYESMRIIWWLLLGVLLTGFAIMDGFDLGVALLLPFVARKDIERRVVINTVGPVWEGNQVWIILGAGAIFAAWPIIYAVSFSGFYLAMLIVLLGFILRPVGFKYRSKMPSERWRSNWDKILFIAGLLPSLIFGVALGNVLQGVPFFFDDSLRVFYTGSLWGLLNPFALLCGLVSVCMLAMHGASYLATKTEGIVRQRAIQYGRIAAIVMLLLFALAGVWVAMGLNGFVVDSIVDHAGPSNPLHKAVSMVLGGWMTNYHLNPLLWIAPLLVVFAVIGQLLCLGRGESKWGFVFSSLAIVGVIATFGLSLFPFLLPSSSHPSMSLLIWDASSSLLTLRIMLVCTIIFMPIILLYTAWVYRVMRGRVTVGSIESDSQNKY